MTFFSSIVSGFLISFIGSLPLGNMNVTVMKMASDGYAHKVYQFSFAAVLVEMLYMLICMQGVALATSFPLIFLGMQWAMVVVMIVLAVNCFRSLNKQEKETSSQTPVKKWGNGYFLGFAMSATNVLHFTFWTGWITIAIQNSWVQKNYTAYSFILAAGMATFLSFVLFALVGKKLAAWLKNKKRSIDLVLGILFVGVAIMQLYQILK
jgi:threonine/homoserine/homoserine lactone efflux protein